MNRLSFGNDASQPDPIDPWDRTFEYAPTPGNFGRSPIPSLCSPPFGRILDEDTLQPTQTDQLQFIPVEKWDEKKKYVQQKPICIHYLNEWKVNFNGRPVTKVTERNVAIKPSEFWNKCLKDKVEKIKLRRVFHNQRVRLEKVALVASIMQYRSQSDFHQESDSIDVDWTEIEEQLLEWGSLIKKGKQLRLDISINYIADDAASDPRRSGDKRGASSATNRMLLERDARIDAEVASGRPTAWRHVYQTMRCQGPCKNKDWYCWQDPNGKKHYPLESYHLTRLTKMVEGGQLELDGHDDVPSEVREQLYANEHKQREKKQKNLDHHSTESTSHSININVLPSQSPSSSILTTAAWSPPLAPLPASDIVDPILFPDLPLEVAVEEYSSWQKSHVVSQRYKDDIDKVHDIALENGLELRQIYKDQDPEDFIKQGVIIGVARRFVSEIRKWIGEQVSDI